MFSAQKVLMYATLISLNTTILSFNPATYGTNFGIRQIAVQIASANAIPVYGPGNPAINQSGTYALANDIDGALVIEHDTVNLSLNGYRVTGDSQLGYGILVNGYKHIVISDGVVGPDTELVSTVTGIVIQSAQDVLIKNCSCIHTAKGIAAKDSQNVIIDSCRSQFFTDSGFHVASCTTALVQNCIASSNSDTKTTTGFKSENSTDNSFENCTATNLTAQETAVGFWLKNPQKNRVQLCTIDSITTGSNAQGIFIEQSAATTPTDLSGDTVRSPRITRYPLYRAGTAQPTTPRVATANSGKAITVWSQFNGSENQVFASFYNGSSWEAAVNISNDTAHDAYAPVIAFDANGNALAVWNESDGTEYQIYARRFDNTTGWEMATTNICNFVTLPQNASAPALAFDSSGNAFAVWVEYVTANATNKIFARKYSGGTWVDAGIDQTAIPLSSNGGTYAPAIAFDTLGNAFALWAERDIFGQDTIWYAHFDGVSWSAASQLSSSSNQTNNPPIVPSLAVYSDKMMAVWHQESGATLHDQVLARYFNGSLGNEISISNDQTNPNPAYLPKIAVDTNGNFLATWTESNGSQTQIYTRRFDAASGTWTGESVPDGTITDQTATNISNAITNPKNAESPAIATTGTESDAIVAWIEPALDNTNQVYAREYTAENGWIEAGTDNTAAVITEKNPATKEPANPEIGSISAAVTKVEPIIVYTEESPEGKITILAQNNPSLTPPAPGDSVIINNTINNVRTTSTPANGIGIYNAQATIIVTQNKVAFCDIAYNDLITNVKSGYAGSNFMYNIALPS